MDRQRKRQVRSELTEEEQPAIRVDDAARHMKARARQRDAEMFKVLRVPQRQLRSTRARPAQGDREEACASNAVQQRRARARLSESKAAEVRSAYAEHHTNASTANGVAVVNVGEDEDIPRERLFVLHDSSGRLQIVISHRQVHWKGFVTACH